MSRILLLVVTLTLSACALARFSVTPEGQPVYVLVTPLCLVACASSIGTARSEGDGATQSLAQTTGAGAGLAYP